MGYAEVIFEPGSKSLMSYDSEAELQAALKEHHNRAVSGADGGPAGNSAERISKVITYPTNPGESDGTVSADAIKELVDGMASDGRLNAQQLISAVLDEVSPTYPQDQGKHESIYKAEGTELDMGFLDAE